MPCSLGSLILDDDFPSGSQDIQANSWSLFHYEVVMRFQNIPKRSQELNLHLLVHDTVLFQSHVAHIKSNRHGRPLQHFIGGKSPY